MLYFCSVSLMIKQVTVFMDPKESLQNTQEAYEKLTKDYTPSQYINTEWEMQNGFYKQYSVFDENCTGVSGTVSATKVLKSYV